MGRQLMPCGSVGAYQRHRRRGEPIDGACRAEWNDYHTASRRRERKSGPRFCEPLSQEVTPGAVIGAVDRCGLPVEEAAELLGVPVDHCLELLSLGRRGYRGGAS